MRKAFFILACASVMIACSDSGSSSEIKKDSSAANTSTPSATENPVAKQGLALVAKSDCFTCHKVAEKTIGPSYMSVAEKYPNNKEVIDSLAKKIITGGAGNWGTVPMTPHPQIPEADAKTMVEYILSLKQ
jgi:cytochrome c